MKKTAQELQDLIVLYTDKFNSFSDKEFSDKPNPLKWSKKQVVGHLIDSAQNNLRRFIVGQYEVVPPQIIYDQDFWVAANGYQNIKKEDVIVLWRLINQQICEVLKNMPSENYSKECNTSKDTGQLRTLEWLAQDYVKHMKHHLNQIIPGSFDIIYK